jgi:serine/threonine-protein kinase
MGQDRPGQMGLWVDAIDVDVEQYLNQVGEVFEAFREQDSGCVSFGVLAEGRRWFVKHSSDGRAIAGLKRARELHAAVQHPALPACYHSFETPDGFALVLDWVPGELLRKYVRVPRGEHHCDPACPHVRFRSLPLPHVLEILDTIYDLHLLLADRGYVASDFYDGCIIYDWKGAQTFLCDFDEYRRGPFVLQAERNFGSRRFMAPEEFQRGATIDQVTNVFTLGRTAVILLGDGSRPMTAWRGTDAMRRVVARATNPDRDRRHPSVRAFVEDWRPAVG